MQYSLTKTELLTAYNNIKKIIDLYIDSNNIQFIASPLAPNTYKGMRNYRDDMGHFLVFDGGDHGFLGEHYNVKFRALHDYMHYTYNLSFKFEDENKLSKLTAFEFYNIAWNQMGLTAKESYDVYMVINAEIGGQIEYYVKHNDYVKDQSKFILEYLNVDIDA